MDLDSLALLVLFLGLWLGAKGLKAADVQVDRRMLAEIAVSDPQAFDALVELARASLPASAA